MKEWNKPTIFALGVEETKNTCFKHRDSSSQAKCSSSHCKMEHLFPSNPSVS